MHANQAHQIIDALSKDKYIHVFSSIFSPGNGTDSSAGIHGGLSV